MGYLNLAWLADEYWWGYGLIVLNINDLKGIVGVIESDSPFEEEYAWF